MTRRATPLVLLVLLAPLAGAEASVRAYAAEASACHPVSRLAMDPGAPCPRARQEGLVHPGSCEGAVCGFAVDVSARGEGLLDLRKQLSAEIETAPFLAPVPLCSAQAAQPSVSCQGQAIASVELTDGACTEIRVRSVFVELSEYPPTLPVRAENLVTLCRAGDALIPS